MSRPAKRPQHKRPQRRPDKQAAQLNLVAALCWIGLLSGATTGLALWFGLSPGDVVVAICAGALVDIFRRAVRSLVNRRRADLDPARTDDTDPAADGDTPDPKAVTDESDPTGEHHPTAVSTVDRSTADTATVGLPTVGSATVGPRSVVEREPECSRRESNPLRPL